MKENESLFRNRIVGHGEKPADQFQSHPLNFRTHPQDQRAAVKGSLTEVGWVKTVIENVRTGNLIDGHERVWQALRNNEDVPYTQVDLSEEEEALVLATLDPMTGMAGHDKEVLSQLLEGVNTGDAALQALIAQTAEEAGLYGDGSNFDEDEDGVETGHYTREIDPPIYEITGDKPDISELIDTSKTDELLKAIEASGIEGPLKDFLVAAAWRHTVFNFKHIAEFYAHSDHDVQSLMEDSALVIIDINRAIENGFVKISQELLELAAIDGNE